MFTQEFLVTISLIELPRADHRRVRPRRAAAEQRGIFRKQTDIRDKWETVPSPRCSAAISRSHFEKALPIKRAGDRTDGDLRVACPSKPLVALRAVSRYVQQVVLFTPDNVLIQLVQKRIGRANPAGSLQIGIDADRREILCLPTLRRFVHTQIAEAVKRVVCAAGLDSATADILDSGFALR